MVQRFWIASVVATVSCGAVATTPSTPSGDASLDTSTTDSSPEWDPSRLEGLALWLVGDDAFPDVSKSRSLWSDRSGNKNDARLPSAPESSIPTVGRAANGHQTVRFAAARLVIADSPSMRWSSGFVLEAVLRQPSPSSLAGVLFTKQDHVTFAGPELGLNGVGILSFNVEPLHVSIDTIGQPPINGSLHRLRASWDAATSRLSLRVDTNPPIEKTDPGVVGVDATGFDAVLGASFDGLYPAFADIAEIVVVGATSDSSDVSRLEAYLDAKYAL